MDSKNTEISKKERLVVTLFFLAIMYFLTSFFEADFDFTEWSMTSKGLCMGITIIFIKIYYLGKLYNPEN